MRVGGADVIARRAAPTTGRRRGARARATTRARARIDVLKPLRAKPRFAAEQSVDARVHRGAYCEWTVDAADRAEVLAYRGSLSAMTLGAALTAWLCAAGDHASAERAYLFGGLGLGGALLTVHVYVGEIRAAMRALWAAGFLGSAAIAMSAREPLPVYVWEHPMSVLLVGPMFAALTGLAFKEGMCYGKPEAALLFFAVPAMCLSHLFGASADVCGAEANVVLALLVVFALRKYSQPIKDDIGDKSIFMFQALEEGSQEQLEFLKRARENGFDV